MSLSPAKVRHAWEAWRHRHNGHELCIVLGPTTWERRLRTAFTQLPVSLKLVLAAEHQAAKRGVFRPWKRTKGALTDEEWTAWELEQRTQLGFTSKRELVALHRSVHGGKGPAPPPHVVELAKAETAAAARLRAQRVADATAALVSAAAARRRQDAPPDATAAVACEA